MLWDEGVQHARTVMRLPDSEKWKQDKMVTVAFTPFDTYIKHDYTQRIKAIYEKILFGKIPYPRHLSTEARDLLSKLLVLEPANRFQGKLDRQGKAVREHPWFKVNKISHSSILKTKPPIKPRKMRDTHDMTVIVDPKMRSKSMEGEKVK